MRDYFDSARPKLKKGRRVTSDQARLLLLTEAHDLVQDTGANGLPNSPATDWSRPAPPPESTSAALTIGTFDGHRNKPPPVQPNHVEGEPRLPVKTTKKRVRVKTERRREQCRQNQARYRNKLRTFAVGLEDSVLQLQQLVQQLEIQRRSLYNSVSTRESATRVVMEYFRLFQGGLTVFEPLPASSRPPLETQIRFVMSAFHHRTRVGDDFGNECFLEQCRRFSTFYDGLRILPQRCVLLSDPGGCVTVEAKVIVQLTITETTIQQLYPHLLKPQFYRIKWKMLGQRMNCRASQEFTFDEDGKVVSVEWTIDFVEALHRFLSIKETAVVLQQAQVLRDAYLLERGADMGGTDDSISHRVWEPSVSVEGDDQGFLIHDGKGDDYVMV